MTIYIRVIPTLTKSEVINMTISSIANNSMEKNMLQLATGKRINSAADDAAGLAISEKITAQIRGLEQGINNTEDMNNLVRTAEGGLSGISDQLQRMRELSIQASNGTLTDSDRKIIQNEINQIKQGIGDVVSRTEFNNQKLLNGSFTGKLTASSANGTGTMVSIPNMSLESLGIAEFDVTNPANADISVLDKAMEKVVSARSELGATSNTFMHNINASQIQNLNQAAARSRIADADMGKTAIAVNRDRVMNQLKILTQKNEMDRQQQSMGIFSMLR